MKKKTRVLIQKERWERKETTENKNESKCDKNENDRVKRASCQTEIKEERQAEISEENGMNEVEEALISYN